MAQRLTRERVKAILEGVMQSLPKRDCETCDCLQGFLTQLTLDAEEDVEDLLAKFEVEKSVLHGCLGCDPCPPGKAYADYLREQEP